MLLRNIPNHILCVRLDNMGDVLLTSPAFRALSETFPKSHITLLTSSRGAEIAPFLPEIDQTLILNALWMNHYQTSSELFTCIEKLKNECFDTAFIFTNFSQNPLPAALLCFLAGIHTRIAFCRENPYHLLTHWIPDTEPFSKILHGVKRQLQLAKTIGASTTNEHISIQVKSKDKDLISSLLQNKKINVHAPFILLHPGASEKKRQYSVQFFAQLAEKLINEYNYQVGVTGTKNEYKLCNFIHHYCHQKTMLFPDLPIGQLIALIDRADVLVSNNTGPVHIAAGLGTPVVVFYAQTNPEHTPWQVPHKVFYFQVPKTLQSKNILLEKVLYTTPPLFTVDTVIQAIEEIMNVKKITSTKNNSFTYPPL